MWSGHWSRWPTPSLTLYDVVDLLTGLTDRCVDLPGVSAAGVMLASPAGSLGLVASSSEAMRLLELFELQAQEGPCLDAFRIGEPVGHENLEAGAGRWPSFSAAALQAGFRSASALPLRWREVTLGVMNLLSITRAPMAEADLIVARAFADLATLSITQHRASAEAQRLNEQLSAALTSRVVIEQAKGVITGGPASTWPRLSPGCGPTPATTTCASPTSPRPPSTAPWIPRPGPATPGKRPACSPRGQRRWPHGRRSRGDHLRRTWRNRPGVVARRVRAHHSGLPREPGRRGAGPSRGAGKRALGGGIPARR